MDLRSEAKEMAKQAKEVSRLLARLSTDTKNKALFEMADDLEKNQAFLIEENKKDLSAGEQAHLSSAMMDRLRITPEVIQAMAKGLREVAHLPDPVGEIVKMWRRPNGLTVGRMRIPIGVIGIIYESRPNVTADAAGLCLKSGNAITPRGGEAFIRFVATHSKIPVIKHYKGVCHIFVDETADPEMALRICLNAKVQRPGVCNAMETLLVHERIGGV